MQEKTQEGRTFNVDPLLSDNREFKVKCQIQNTDAPFRLIVNTLGFPK